MTKYFNDYCITDDKTMLSIDDIKNLLEQSYWAENRSKDVIRMSLQNSICFGVYDEKKLIGFGRVVTDFATMFWICDILVDKNYRGQGIGKELMKAICYDEKFKGLLGILATKDAHGLYEQYGFKLEAEKIMIKPRDEK